MGIGEIILYVYLTGWAGTSGYFIYECYQGEEPHTISRNDCAVMSGVFGALWPMGAAEWVNNKF